MEHETDFESLLMDGLERERMPAEESRKVFRFSLGPAWRWEKAQLVALRRRISKRVECDSTFWQLVNHFYELPKEMHESLCGGLQLDTAAAEAIFVDPIARLNVEARILARQSPEEVAARTGCAAQTVRDYCSIFFDVLENLGASSWLAVHVFHPEGEFANDLHSVVLRDAYQGGSAVCEHWLERLPVLGQECDLTTEFGREVKRLELHVRRSQLQRQAPLELGKAAVRIGNLSPHERVGFIDASEVVERHIAQSLGDILSSDENAQQVMQIDRHSHKRECRQRHSA
ncbi:hypothetical protein Poly59_27360 [Rubripirellula reticaptiva]|uniref:Uncharacterized protein n=2 Tax=Rubripirellula reticaptiva TaxID=2528013 RepID=A0A5C6EU64_9BACT|nr:hypothetical protein Poly59_27360 [Rubripirellula reticaptiva]